MPNTLFRDLALLVLLATMWSSSFTAIKVGVETFPPATLAMIRVSIGALVLFLILKAKGLKLPRNVKIWVLFLWIGLFGNAIPFVLINWGEQKIDSGLAAIIIASVPLATLILGRLFSDEILNTRRLLGVLVGFSGVVVLIGPEHFGALDHDILRPLAVFVAAVCYATAAILFRKLPGLNPLEHGAGVLIASACILVPASIIMEYPWTIEFTWQSVAIASYLGLVPTAMATLVLIVVIASRGATFLALNNYLIPFLGVMWGVLFLGEVVSKEATVALLLIVCGIAIAGAGPSTLKDIVDDVQT